MPQCITQRKNRTNKVCKYSDLFLESIHLQTVWKMKANYMFLLFVFYIFTCLLPTGLSYGNYSTEDPRLTSFVFDKSNIYAKFGFDRLVDATTFNISKLRFQGVQSLTVLPTSSSYSDYVISFDTYHTALTGLGAQGNKTFSVTIFFSADQYAKMVMMGNAFSSSSNVYVTMDRGMVLSTPGAGAYPSRPITSTAAFKVTTYMEDTLQPYLKMFGVNMNSKTLTLLFSEPILLSSVTTYGLAAQIKSNVIASGAYARFYYNSNPIVSYSDYQRNITVSFGTDSFNLITSYLNLWSDAETTYLSAWTTFAADLANNLVTTAEIDYVQGIPVSYYSTDTTAPTLVYFDFNFNAGSMTVTFSETINIDYFNVSKISLQSTRVLMANTSVVSLANPKHVSNSYSSTVNITFSSTQMTSLQLSNGIGTYVNSTYIVIEYGACIDMSNAQNVYQGGDATSLFATRVRNLFIDVTRPQLLYATMDLTAQTITFTFSEVIKISSLSTSQVSLQSQATVSTTMEAVNGIRSTYATVTTKKNSLSVTFQMKSTLFNLIKTSSFLGRSINSTFVTCTKLFITDVASPSNLLFPISTAAAMRFTTYVPDTVAPFLTSWYFNNDQSMIYLTFSEPVDTEVFDVTQIALYSSSYFSPATTTFTLTTSSYVVGLATDLLTVQVQLSSTDANTIKVRTPLCVSSASCYLTFGATLTTDTATYRASGAKVANSVVPVTLKGSSSKYVSDRTGPLMLSFSYDAGYGKLSMTFDEPVLLQHPSRIALYSDQLSTHKFGLSSFSRGDGDRSTNVTINLCRYDFVHLKLNSSVAATADSLYLSLDQGAFSDLFSNAILSISNRKSTAFVSDTVAPVLTAFHYNRSTSILNAFFNDVLYMNATNPIKMIMVGSSGVLVGLSTALLKSVRNSNEVILDLSLMASSLTKANIGLLQRGTALYLSAAGIVEDSPNRNVNAKMPVTAAIKDGNTILSFWLDLEFNYLYLEFASLCEISSLDASQIILSSTKSSAVYVFSSLNGTESVGANFIRSSFSGSQMLSIIEKLTFSTRADLRLSLGASAIVDTNGYQLSSLLVVPCSFLHISSTTPTLVSFDLDMGVGQLTMRFSKPVLISSLRVTAIYLCNSRLPNATVFQLTTSKVISSNVADDSVVISLNQGPYPNDREVLNVIRGVATSTTNLYLFAEAGYASDVSVPPVYLSAINQANATQASSVTVDLLPPKLLYTNLDLTKRKLYAFFDEAIKPSSNIPSMYTLAQTTTNPLLAKRSLRFSNTSLFDSYGRMLVINISRTDFDAIMFLNPDLCTSASNCYLSIIGGAVTDMSISANPILDVFFRFGVKVASFTRNYRPAVIDRFDVSMQNGTMQLYFSDVILCSSLNMKRITLQSLKFVGTTGTVYYLDNTTKYTCSSRNVRYIPLEFGVANLVAIKAITALLKSTDRTFLSLFSGAFYDVSGNPNDAVVDGDALAVYGYFGDTVPPKLLSYTVTAQALLILNFNEPVNPNTLTISQFAFQDNVPYYSKIYALAAASLTMTDTYKMKLTISLEADYFRITTDSVIFTSQTRTYLSWGQLSIYDMSTNALIALPTSKALIMGPSVQYWDLNMNTKLMTLYFADSVNASFAPSGMTIQNVFNTSAETNLSFVLTTKRNVMVRDSLYTSFTALLGNYDVNYMKSIGLASSSSTYLSMQYAQTTSTFAGTIVPYLKSIAITTDNALLVRFYTPDTTRPSILYFDLNLNDPAYLLIGFDEPVKASSLYYSGLVLLSKTYGNFAVVSSGQASSQNLTDLEVSIVSSAVLNSIKISYKEGPLDGLMLSANGILDTYGNSFIGNFEYSAIQIRKFTADTTSPEILSSTLSLGYGYLTIEFTEVVEFSTCFPFYVTIQSNSTVATSAFTLTLTNYSIVLQPSVSSILINMNFYSIDNFQLDYGLYTILDFGHSLNQSYIQLHAIKDLFNNEIVTSAKLIDTIIPDIVAPELWSFSVVSSSGHYRIYLYFSEVIKIGTFNCSSFVFASSASSTASEIFSLGESLCYNETLVDNVLVFSVDTARVSTVSVFQSSSTTYLAYPISNSLTDHAGNALLNISLSSAIQQGTAVVKYMIDMVKGQATIIFSAPIVRSGAFDITKFGFYSTVTGMEFYFNTSSSVGALFASSPANDTIVVLTFSTSDLIDFKYIDVKQQSLYLIVESYVIKDIFGEWVLPITAGAAIKPIAFVADTVKPLVTGLSLDMSNDLLQLTFDEPIRLSSIVISNFRLQANKTSLVNSVKLTGGTISVSKNIVTFYFSTVDMVTIKLLTVSGLATSNLTSYLSFTFNSLTDYAGNALKAVPFSNALQITTYIKDTKPPKLSYYALDFTALIVTFYFTEPVISSTVNMTDVTIQNAFYSANGVSYVFRGGTVLTANSNIIQVKLLLSDVNNIKLIDRLGRTKQLSYFVINSNFCTDMFGNQLVAILDGAAQAVTYFTPDAIAPAVLAYTYNANEYYILFNMTEPVQLTTVHAEALTVSLSRGSKLNYTLSQFSVPTSNGISFNIILHLFAQDMNTLNARSPLASNIDLTWVSFTSLFVEDVFGNEVTPILPSSAIKPEKYVKDITRPYVLDYKLDMNLMEIILVFSESVSLTTLDTDQIILQNCPVRRFCTHIDLNASQVSFTIENAQAVMTIKILTMTEYFLKYFGIGLTKSTSLLAWTDVFAADYTGNFMNPVWDASVLNFTPILPNSLVPDTTRPKLENWFVDRVHWTIHLRFSEPVRVANLTKAVLFASQGRESHSLQLVNHTLVVQYLNFNSELNISFKGDSCPASQTCSLTQGHLFLVNYAKYQLNLFIDAAAVFDLAIQSNPSSSSVIPVQEGGPACGQCPTGSYASKNCTESKDEVCSSCSTCPTGMYTQETCNPYQDTLCGDCGVCGVGMYISTQCHGFIDTVCSPCTICSDLEFASQTCELGHNAVCTSCKRCFFSDPTIREMCSNDRYRWWASENCCVDQDGNQVQCNLVDRQNMYIAARNGRHHWVFPQTSPPVDASGTYAFGKTWPL